MDTRTHILGDELRAAVEAGEITYREIANALGLDRDESIRNIGRKTVRDSKYYFPVCEILGRDPADPKRRLSTRNQIYTDDKRPSLGHNALKPRDAGKPVGKEAIPMPPATDRITFLEQELHKLKDRIHELELTMKDLTLVPRAPGGAPKMNSKKPRKKAR